MDTPVLELTLSGLSKLLDDKLANVATKEDVQTLKSDIEFLKRENNSLKNEVSSLKKEKKVIEKKLYDLECNNRKNNLIFYHVPLARETSLKDAIKDFCVEFLGTSSGIWVNRAYPLNKTKSIILAQFPNNDDIIEILSKVSRLRGTRYSVHQDFPKEVRDKRAQLLAVKDEIERLRGNINMYISYDHLIINNFRFGWENKHLEFEGMDGCEKLNRLFNYDFTEFLTRLEETGPTTN